MMETLREMQAMKVELTLEEMREITEVLSQLLDEAGNDAEKAKEIVRADFAEMGKTLQKGHVIFWVIDTLVGLRAKRDEEKKLLRRGNANRSKRKITRIHSIPQPERESKRK